MGGKVHLKLNTGGRPIANKYREGKMKRTLKRVGIQSLSDNRFTFGLAGASHSLCWVAVRMLGGPVLLDGSASVRMGGEDQMEDGSFRGPL